MSNPRAPGTTGAWISLGSGTKPLVAPVDPCFKNCKLCAAILDRHADLLLAQGQHLVAERLSNLAADLRQAVSA